jgi:mono/diheme cytochrome c family protein
MNARFLAAPLAALFGTLLGLSAAQAAPDDYDRVERGRALATAADCTGCHSLPGQPALAGGLPLETPFGIIMTPNITPDAATGLGRWTPDDFAGAMQHGRRPDGTLLYPAFPYPYYTRMPRADIDAIYAYLRTIPPVDHAVDRDTLPFPFNIRLVMKVWNWLYFTPGPLTPEPNRSAEYNRGAYLVEAPGHCGACHTPKTRLGGDDNDSRFGGGVLQAWFAPNITADPRLGLGAWSIEEIVEYLQTGRNARSAASGPMTEVITNSTSRMPPADLRAIAVYLKERGAPAVPAPQPVAESDARMVAGRAVYADNCMACHVGDGSGIARLFPRLAGSQVVQQTDPTTLMRVVLEGSKAAGTDRAPTAPAMPSFGWRLNDAQVADVLTYLRSSFGNAAAPVSADQVKEFRRGTTRAAALP